ncbi:NACHT domain-containing protein [Saccharopolyspora sp. NPDC000359]|uniref:NACHT domain-containing protein n=1 Tax=Saccharopolyspora sp. NPDC000359 TaxID=3154251 RepID=UPI003323A16C
MPGGDQIHNENSGPVGGNFLQVGNLHGDVMLWRKVPADESLAGDLASVVGERSRKEEEQWRIDDPDALLVRWHEAEDGLFDPADNIHRPLGGHEPAPLSGQFTTIRSTFQATGTQRLVILGRAGAGKTVLAHRLILDLLDHRDHRGSVPVLFSLNDWNPAATGLRDWMIDRLLHDHPFLEQRDSTGKRGAEVLVDRDWILPVLDGFDEIPHRHHHSAVQQVSQVRLPLVLTSRPDEYASAARSAKAVGRAAAIEIEDLALDQAERYLCRSTNQSRASEWAAVFEQLQLTPNKATSRNLTSVLTTPLMVMLARTLYNDTNERVPGELLDTTRFPESTDLERHLLSGYVDTVYDRRRTGVPAGATHKAWSPDQARHWLGSLANGLRNRSIHGFTWWQLPALLPRRTRILATSVTSGLVLGLMYVLTSVLTNGPTYGFAAVLPDALLLGAATWLTFGLPAGFLNELRFSRRQDGREPERLRLYWRRSRRPQRHAGWPHLTRAASELTKGLLVGLLVGLAVSLALRLANVLAGALMDRRVAPFEGAADLLAKGFAEGVAIGTAFGVVNVVVSALGERHDPHDSAPWRLLTTDRTITLVRTVPAAGLVISIAIWTLGIPALTALLFGALAALLRVALSAWGSWLLFARLWLPLTGRLPWRPQRFFEDAHDRGILRQAGASYQFRHAQLRDHLADHHRTWSLRISPSSIDVA